MTDVHSPRQDSLQEPFRKPFLVGLTVGITLLFLFMIRQFLLSVLMAAIFSGMAYPLYRAVLRHMNGRRPWASVSTIAVILVVVGLPLLGLLGLVANQAVEVTQAAGPWIERQISQVGALDQRLRNMPFLDRPSGGQQFFPSSEVVVAKAGEVASSAGSFLVRSLAQVTRGTVGFFLQLFILLYAMFFFLADGEVDPAPHPLLYTPGAGRRGAVAGEVRLRGPGHPQGLSPHRHHPGCARGDRVLGRRGSPGRPSGGL